MHHGEENRWLQAYTLLEELAARPRLELAFVVYTLVLYSNVHFWMMTTVSLPGFVRSFHACFTTFVHLSLLQTVVAYQGAKLEHRRSQPRA